MPLTAVMNWFGWQQPPPEEPPHEMHRLDPVVAAELAVPMVADRPPPKWNRDRLKITDALWGQGYQFPGAEIETLRLAKPLGLTKASSLLLLGAGAGGPACSLAINFGAWVSGFEADSDLVATAIDRVARRNLTKHAQTELWDPEEPKFRDGFYHHGMALEALHGSQPERVLSAVARALKPSGHVVITELVADTPLDPGNPVVAGWAHLERRNAKALPTEVTITRILGRLGFDVRVCEDISERHVSHAMAGWRSLVRLMEDAPPTRREAMSSVQEAELWLLRLRLFEIGSLRLVRWHAIGGG
ncbi:MAG TPA: methyltransferase domain-containing protein [Acetobacteraceae bacterium]|nr:methyltransferase domain-containing protein [Acetobacteraceae bacterium]